MEAITPFIPLIIIIAVIVIVFRWRRSVRYLKHGATHQKSSSKAGAKELVGEPKQPKQISALLEIFRTETLDLDEQWRFDPASDRQFEYLAELTSGSNVSIPDSLTKGQASDAIGLFIEPEEHELTLLKFFKVPNYKNLCQTDARVTLHKIFSDPENVEKWANRPATSVQKDQIRFFGETVPRRLKYTDAEKIIDELVEADEDRLNQWDDLLSAYEDLVDPELRKPYSIRKFSLKQFCDVLDDVESAGRDVSQILQDEDDDVFYKELIKKYPKLKN